MTQLLCLEILILIRGYELCLLNLSEMKLVQE